MAQGGVTLWIALGVGLAACSAPAAAPAPTPVAPAPAPPTTPTPTPTPAQPAAAPKPAPSTDLCGATALQSLIGKPRTDIPVPVDPNRRRVLCSTCAMTPDVAPFRQTIIYDVNSGLVTAVKCG